MRSIATSCALLLVIASGVACSSNEGEDADTAEQDVTGGTTSVESPVVYLFDGLETNLTPKCTGALLGEKVAVTAKACAKVDMIVGLATDDDGRGASRAKITKVHVPSADAEIAVIELDRAIGGNRAVITNAPLRDGYAVNGVATVDGGWFGPSKGKASSVKGRLTSETETHSTLFPAGGREICAGDLGAPVCSSTGTMLLSGLCGLSGLVIGPEDTSPTNTEPTPTGAPTATCSKGAWKVVTLGRYADFLERFAPEAFEPLVIDRAIVRNFPFEPEGLWGYKNGGRVASCKVETTKLDPVDPGVATKLIAKASFSELGERAAPLGRFGIASAKAPTKMRWLPAKQIESSGRRPTLAATFEGAVSALAEGEYVVAFRASVNGESWTNCDVDGIENGFSLDKALELTVSSTRTPPPDPKPDGGPQPNDPTPSDPEPGDPTPSDPKPDGGGPSTPGNTETETPPPDPRNDDPASDYSDPSPSTSDPSGTSDPSSDADEPAVAKRKKKTSDSGCSASPNGRREASALPLIGLLFAAAALRRRRSDAL